MLYIVFMSGQTGLKATLQNRDTLGKQQLKISNTGFFDVALRLLRGLLGFKLGFEGALGALWALSVDYQPISHHKPITTTPIILTTSSHQSNLTKQLDKLPILHT
jgi:hypothetical protein